MRFKGFGETRWRSGGEKGMRIPTTQRREKSKKSLKGQAHDDLRNDERGETCLG